MSSRIAIILALITLASATNAQTTEYPVLEFVEGPYNQPLLTILADTATTMTISGGGKTIEIDKNGKVNCPLPLTEQQASDNAEMIAPYGGIYLAIWRAYCPAKPLSTFEKPND